MTDIIVITGAALLTGFILWWFFGKREVGAVEADQTDDSQEVTVVVDGGYTPNTVVLKQGVPAKILFDRKDPSGCFNEVMFPDFGIHKVLPVNEPYPIEIDTSKAGEYQYACGMNMFHGKVVIK